MNASAGATSRPVSGEDAGVRLDRWFARHYPEVSFGCLAKWLRTGQVRVDGRRAQPGTRLAPGQIIRIPPWRDAPGLHHKSTPVAPVPADAIAQLRESILYRDDTLIAVNKPAGLAVQGGSGTTLHLERMLDALAFGRKERPRLVHRLDKDTSGVLLLARDARTAARVAALFRARKVDKLYWALVVGVPHPAKGRVSEPLAKRPGAGGEKVVVAASGGRRALTAFETIAHAGRTATWLALHPLTGRTHQLRVHCAALGAPIVGDGKYGGKVAFLPGIAPRVHLHALSLSLPWPEAGERLEITAPLTGHMAETWAFLGFDAARPRNPGRRQARRRNPGRRR